MPDRSPGSGGTEHVVLVNGLWLRNPALWPLAARLRGLGFRVHSFSYPSVRDDLRGNAARLQNFLATLPAGSVHFIGYSLGGLIIRALFHFHPQQRPGRIVLLGSPQTGSHAAQSLARHALGRRLLGRSVAELVAGIPQQWDWPERDIGVIAGSRSLGLGRLVARLAVPNDGSIAEKETHVPTARARLLLPVAHSAMLLKPIIAQQAGAFLRNGQFESLS